MSGRVSVFLVYFLCVVCCLVFKVYFFKQFKSLEDSADGYRAVISLTTLPNRLHLLPLALASLADQPVQAIYVFAPGILGGSRDAARLRIATSSLCEKHVCSIDVWRQDFLPDSPEQSQARFRFIIGGPDYGPGTKLLGVLAYEPDPTTWIITVDDDVVYDAEMAETLLLFRHVQGALGFSCEELPKYPSFGWYVISGAYGWKYMERVVECNGWLHGYQGVLYRRGFFADDAYECKLKGCFWADDVRLSGYLASHGIKRYVYPHFTNALFQEKYTHLPKENTSALSLVPDTMVRNQWPCVRLFAPYWSK